MKTMAAIDTDLRIIREILHTYLQGYAARVYFFGSRALGTSRRDSDVDIAILPLASIPQEVFASLREAFDESDSLYKVDLVNLEEAEDALKERVLLEGILWDEYENA